MVPHRGTNWAALWLTAQIGRDAVLSESYGRGYLHTSSPPFDTMILVSRSKPMHAAAQGQVAEQRHTTLTVKWTSPKLSAWKGK